jgi:hypothetical protein
MTEARTIRDFDAGADLWSVVDPWAQRQGYRLQEQDGDRRVYKKGTGMMTGARLVSLSRSNGTAHMEACVTANFLARLSSLFILPKEITIESGGMKAALPRKLGRSEVNDLMKALGQPEIA